MQNSMAEAALQALSKLDYKTFESQNYSGIKDEKDRSSLVEKIMDMLRKLNTVAN